MEEELSKPGFNSFGLSDCKAPKVLGDIVESIAGAIFLDSSLDTSVVWRVIFFLYIQSSFYFSYIEKKVVFRKRGYIYP